MKRQEQTILYHLLPVVFWLLAIVGTIGALFILSEGQLLHPAPYTRSYLYGYLVATIILVCIAILRRIPRHTDSVEECFQVALLLGIASYWLPTVVFITVPVWIYLTYRNLFSFRAFFATLVGYAAVAIWAAVAVFMGWIANPWFAFFAIENAVGWIPAGVALLAWAGSTIVQQNLRVR